MFNSEFSILIRGVQHPSSERLFGQELSIDELNIGQLEKVGLAFNSEFSILIRGVQHPSSERLFG